MKIKQKIEEFR